ncbi:MAG: HDOD domain-containing protein [Candidatus Synoicihabitans palmerolidicus]|nr:HDOD domain-containing protein [Candidatus Synoicihabitans palmerolidicus]
MATHPITTEGLLAAARRLPSSPRVFGALEAALRNPDVAIDAVVDIVRVAPSLAVRGIKAANSAIFRRGDPVESLDTAIGRIGLREIHRLMGAAVADQLFAVGVPLYRIDGDNLWMNALVTALSAEQLAAVPGRDSREAYTLGLLRSSGRMLLQRVGQDEALPPTAGTKKQERRRGRGSWRRVICRRMKREPSCCRYGNVPRIRCRDSALRGHRRWTRGSGLSRRCCTWQVG